MGRVLLPYDAWADLRDPKLVPERLRRPVKAALFAIQRDAEAWKTVAANGDTSQMTPETIGAFDDLNDLAAVALIADWSYGLPVNVDTLRDTPGAVYDAIQAAVAPLMLEMMPNFTADGVNDPKAATTG